jgi:hypothetical protein
MSKLPRLGPPGSASEPLFPAGWDLVILGGRLLPGKATVSKCNVKRKVDKKGGIGSKGANPTVHGRELQDLEVKVTVKTDEQVDELLDVLKLILADPDDNPRPLAIDHPTPRSIGIESVILLGSTGLMMSSTRGVRELTMSLREHRQPKPAKSQTVKGAPGDVRNKRTEDARRRNPPPSANPTTIAPPR